MVSETPKETNEAYCPVCSMKHGSDKKTLICVVTIGTGKGAMALAQRGLVVEACDSDTEMVAQLQRKLSEHPAMQVNAHVSTVENSGLATSSMALVTCLQAWHWVDHDAGLAEMHRVLVSDGRLCIVWNERDLEVPWVSAFESLMEKYNPKYKGVLRQTGRLHKLFAAENPYFTLEDHRLFPHRFQLASADELVRYAQTFSYIQHALTPLQAEEFACDLLALAKEHFGTGPVPIPLHARLYQLASKVKDSF